MEEVDKEGINISLWFLILTVADNAGTITKGPPINTIHSLM